MVFLEAIFAATVSIKPRWSVTDYGVPLTVGFIEVYVSWQDPFRCS
jgi:hypothetical protein